MFIKQYINYKYYQISKPAPVLISREIIIDIYIISVTLKIFPFPSRLYLYLCAKRKTFLERKLLPCERYLLLCTFWKLKSNTCIPVTHSRAARCRFCGRCNIMRRDEKSEVARNESDRGPPGVR